MMSDGERMLLEDAIEQAIETEQRNIKLKRMLCILSVACFILIVCLVAK